MPQAGIAHLFQTQVWYRRAWELVPESYASLSGQSVKRYEDLLKPLIRVCRHGRVLR